MPNIFPRTISTDTIDVATVLNLIGVLTTPPLSGGASLSEMWAYVRYLFAITNDSDLRITSEFQTIDPHQKTILSDDFGMGFTMHWLAQRLSLIAACDGRYFIENHLASVGGTYTGGTAKRGLGKSPDFVALDHHSRLHVIECKGTQSSLAYRNSQLKESARIQKTTIQLPAHLAGESLAAGIFIAGPSGDRSELRIIDPEPPEKYVVREKDSSAAISSVIRGALAKQFRSAGLPRFAAAVAYPRSRIDLNVPEVPLESEEEVNTRRASAEAEARTARGRTFRADHDDFIGRRVRLPLPRPIITKRGEYRAVEIRQGFERDKFEMLKDRSLDASPLPIGDTIGMTGEYRFGETLGRAWVRFGENYFSDLRLLPGIRDQ